MGKKASPALIGGFVVGALALVVACLVFFSSLRLFGTTHRFIAYFDGAVDGLVVGAPVRLKGVEIGTVVDIRLELISTEASPPIPVIIQVDEHKLTDRLGRPADLSRENIQAQIDRGLRARLATQSLVTGLLFISLDYYPDMPARFVGESTQYQEIPTVPSTAEEVMRTLTEVVDKIRALPLEHLVESATETVDGLNRIVNSPEAQRVVASLDETLGTVRKLSADLDTKLVPLTDDVRGGVHDARNGIRDVVKKTSATLDQLDTTLVALRGAIQPDAALGYQLNQTLSELDNAARAIRALADSLNADPSSLVFGREPSPVRR